MLFKIQDAQFRVIFQRDEHERAVLAQIEQLGVRDCIDPVDQLKPGDVYDVNRVPIPRSDEYLCPIRIELKVPGPRGGADLFDDLVGLSVKHRDDVVFFA